jgi:metal-responsive CopG/Arc/MetJ family transcriptional regulator
MKTAISIPDSVFEEAEAFAQRFSLSRSELYTKAIEGFLRAHRTDHVTQKLNEVYAEQDSRLDPVVARMQELSIGDESW